MSQRIQRVQGDSGAASVEYMGAAVLVAVVVGSILVSNPGADTSDGLAQQACRLIRSGAQAVGLPAPGSCGAARTTKGASLTFPGGSSPVDSAARKGWAPPVQAAPKGWNPPGFDGRRMKIVSSCTDRAVQESGGGGITLFGLHLGGGASKSMELRGDGSAWVSKKSQGEVGVDMVLGAASADGSLGLGGQFKANLTGSYTSNYQFSDWRKAEGFYHDGDNAHEPDSRTFDVGIQAGGSVNFGPASLEAGVTGGGRYTVFDNHQLYGDLGSSYTGYLSGKAALGLDLAIAGGKGKAAGEVSYTVVYDRNGDPARLVFTAEGEAGGEGQLQLPGFGPVVGAAGGGGGGGATWRHQWYLDLHDPLNRSSFERAFSRVNWFAVPNLIDLDNGFNGLAGLADRIRQDGIEAESQYALEGGGGGSEARPNDPKKWGGTIGAAILSFGIEGGGSRGTSQLKGDNTTVLDHHDSRPTWRPLSDYALCGKSYFDYCVHEYGADKCPSAAGRLRPGDDRRSAEVV